MCVEDHHTILKAAEDLGKAYSKHLSALYDLTATDGLNNEVMVSLAEVERVARYLKRKANVIGRTQP